MRWTHWILYAVSLPWDLFVAWPLVLLIRALWGKDLRWETPPRYKREVGGGGGPCLTCTVRENSFPVTPGIWPKGWYLHRATGRPWGGTTLGHAIFYGPKGRLDTEGWTRTQTHEHVHVEQAEVAMVQGLLIGLTCGAVLWGLGYTVAGLAVFLALWSCGYLLMGVAGWLTATLRGEEAYWGATHEESARAQTDAISKD